MALRKRLPKLTSCPMCLGFWAALVVMALPLPALVVLVVSGIGQTLYLLREKLLPCQECKSKVPGVTFV